MGGKEFFRFTKRKIIIYSILILLSIIGIIFSSGFGIKPPLWAQIITYPLVYLPLFPLISLWKFIYSNYGVSMSTITGGSAWGGLAEFVMGLIIVLVYQYLLVCILDWIVGKVKVPPSS